MELRPLQLADEISFRRAVDEFANEDPDWPFAFHFDASTDFAEYVRRLDDWSRGRQLPGNFVPNTFLVGVVGDAIVGRVSIRHELNDYLRRYGGHIGYGVVPAQRNRGYASRMLQLALPVAANLDISRALVTCDEGNTASQKVIVKAGGRLDNIVIEPGKPARKMRYWIELM
jgi:predicted acetyltransferase